MTGFDSILIPLDGSKRAEAVLHWVGALPTRQLRLLRVCPPGEDGEASAAREYLEAAVARFNLQDAEVDLLVVAGDPAERIVAEAADTDLIAMTTAGAGAGGRRLFGSVADRVSRHAPAPTVLLRGGRDPVTAAPPQRVVVPLDGSPAAERALPVGTRLAVMLDAPVHLVSVCESESNDTGANEGGAYLEGHAASLRADVAHATAEVRSGTAEEELLASVEPGDVIVLTTHGRGAARRWQIGHVAEKLLRHAPVPVVLVRADGG